MPSDNNVKPSFIKELRVKITLFVLIPVLLSAIYFSYNAYQQAIELAYEDVERHASSLALDIKTEIAAQTYKYSDLTNNRVLGEVPINILFSQYAFNRLKTLVLESPAIEAAFISDGSEFIIEGFPLATLKINNIEISQLASTIINSDPNQLNPTLFYLPQTYAQVSNKAQGHLFIVLPLKKQQSSLVTPYTKTAALFLMLDPSYLLGLNRQQQHSDATLNINNQVYFKDINIMPQANVSVTEPIYLPDNNNVDINVSVTHLKQQYTQKIASSFGLTLIFILILLGIVVLFTQRFTQRILTPMQKLVTQSSQLAKGNYKTSEQALDFTEFETLRRTLNKMATTITNQLSSLEHALAKAEESERLKARFLANMSHEIRTPLNGVTGLLKMIESEPLSANQQAWLKSANQSSKLLLTVVNDVLDFSKIEEGKMTIEHIVVDFNELLNTMRATANVLITDKPITFNSSINLSHYYWYCDPTRLSQILVNLLSNAVKFTEKGEVRLSITNYLQGDKDWLRFEVTDSGIGIKPEKLAKLFRSFEQADVSTTRNFGGTGLGLAISKQLALLMGGDIRVTSEVNVGSHFVVDIPLEKAKSSTENANQDVSAPDLSDKVIVVAEDNKINQTILTHILQHTGATIYLAEDGEQAIEAVRQYQPDVILMDVQMPNMDGVEATKQLREIGFMMPIIMQTANVMDEEVSGYIAIGANDHIAKPIDANQLFAALNNIFH
ncbi:ATP-binding protein [Colwellia sp. MEBiC06753]